MDMVHCHNATRCLAFFGTLVLVFSFPAIGAEMPEIDYEESQASLRLRDFCAADLAVQLDASLAEIPQFDNIRSAAEWTKHNLPSGFKLAFDRAGKKISEEMNQQTLAALLADIDKLELYFYRHIFSEILEIEPYKRMGCEIVIYEYLASELHLRLKLDCGALFEQFQSLGIGDSYDIVPVFFLMIALEATEFEWDVSWFAR